MNPSNNTTDTTEKSIADEPKKGDEPSSDSSTGSLNKLTKQFDKLLNQFDSIDASLTKASKVILVSAIDANKDFTHTLAGFLNENELSKNVLSSIANSLDKIFASLLQSVLTISAKNPTVIDEFNGVNNKFNQLINTTKIDYDKLLANSSEYLTNQIATIRANVSALNKALVLTIYKILDASHISPELSADGLFSLAIIMGSMLELENKYIICLNVLLKKQYADDTNSIFSSLSQALSVAVSGVNETFDIILDVISKPLVSDTLLATLNGIVPHLSATTSTFNGDKIN